MDQEIDARERWKYQKGGSMLEELGGGGEASTISKALSSEIGKKLINEGIKNAPNLYKFGTSKIRNKNFKKGF